MHQIALGQPGRPPLSAAAEGLTSRGRVAVLIITCPCALGRATPTVQTVVSGAMVRPGVLLNSGDAIERV